MIKKILSLVFLLQVMTYYSFASVSSKAFLLEDFNRYKKDIKNAYLKDGKIITSSISMGNLKSREFYLDFEPEHNDLFTSQLPEYGNGIIRSGVKISNQKNVLTYNGAFSPFFYHKNNDRDFTLSIYFNPSIVHGYHTIINRMGIVSNDADIFSEGFAFIIKDGKPMVLFKNLFKFKDERMDIILSSKKSIQPNQWYKMTVTFDGYEGNLKLFLNSNLEDQQTATNRHSDGAVFYPSFSENNNAPLVVGGGDDIGSTFSGYIDEFSILPFKQETVYTEQYPQVRSSYISKVFFLGYNKILKQMKINGENLNNKRTFLYYKTSANFFSDETSYGDEEWRLIDPSKVISGNIVTENSFQPYIQFKVEFENRISNSPATINDLEIIYDELSIAAPKKIEVTSSHSRTMNILWESVNDIHVKGYYVYYSKDHFVNDINYTFFKNERSQDFIFQKQISFSIPNMEPDTNYEVYVVSAGINNILSAPSEKKEILITN